MRRVRFVGVLLFCFMTSSMPVGAQSTPAFEVTSIKQVDTSLPGIAVRGWSCRGSDSSSGHPAMVAATGLGRCRIMGVTLKAMISSFFSFRMDRILGGPGWIESLSYTVEAKAESADTTTRAQLVQMLQTMLVDRFKLKFHKENRQTSGYGLVLARDGHKLKEAGPSDKPAGTVAGPSSISGQTNMASLANALSTRLGVPVVDSTGLAGSYVVSLKWTPTEIEVGQRGAAAADPAGGPSLFTALQEQLGLRLESRTTTIEVMVIDSVDKATEN